MTDPLDQQLRDAMNSGAARFSPAGAMRVTRRHLIRRVHRRQRQASLAVVAVLVIGVGAVMAATNRSADSARRVAAAGGAPSAAATTGRGDGGGPGAGQAGVEQGVSPGGQPATGTGTPHSGTPPTSTGTGGPQVTTVPGTTTTPTPAPPVTPSTAIGIAPTTSLAPAAASRVQGTVLFSPVCPVERVPPDPACAPRPGAARIQLVRGDGTVAAQGNAGSTGHFSIAVPPGTYTVVATALNATSAIGRGCSATPADVVVEAGTTSNVAVSCDTGIR